MKFSSLNYYFCSSNMWLWYVICIIFTVDVFRDTLAQDRNLCDICECIPSHLEPSYVNCNCKKTKVLLLKDEDGDLLSNTKVLNMSTCSFIAFPSGGFPKLKKLKSVQIRNMDLFHLNAGVFPSASNLAIEDVTELIIDSFLGQNNLANIEIKNTGLTEISEDSFKDLKNLEKLVFQNVSIGTIASNALSIMSSNPKLSVKFANCKIDTIQSEGISLQVTKLEMIDTHVNMIHSDGLNITASDSIDIIRCVFGPILSPESFKLHSNKINLNENEFKSLPSNLLRDVHVTNDKKINFIGNTIHDVDLGGFTLSSKLDKLNFVRNKIVCDCTPRKTSILKLRDLFPGLLMNDSNFESIIETNSCKNYNNMPLSDFKRKFLSGALCNDTDLKQLETMYSSDQSGLLNLEQHELVDQTPHSNSELLSSYSIIVFISALSNTFYNYIR